VTPNAAPDQARKLRYVQSLRRIERIAERNIAGISERFLAGGPFTREELYDALIAEAENPSGAVKRVMVERAALPQSVVSALVAEAERVGYAEAPAMTEDGKLGFNRTYKYRLEANIVNHRPAIVRAMRHYAQEVWGNPDLVVDYFAVSKYPVGGHFGMHTDNNGKGHRRRVSVSVGLNDDYEGGELVIEGRAIRLGAGDVVAFTSNLAHWVNPVTRGERIGIALFLLDARNMQPWETKDSSWY
jgi:alkylated DNA repair dioxygenase AlkB